MNKEKNFNSLSTKLSLGFTAIFLMFSVYFVSSNYINNISKSESSALLQLKTITQNLSLTINIDEHEKLLLAHENKDAIKSNSENDIYDEIHQLLWMTRDLNDLQTDVYTWVIDSSQKQTRIVFGVTSGEIPYYRHVWREYPEELLSLINTGGGLTNYSDENGRWISYVSPLINSKGVVVAGIQADIPFDYFVELAESSALKESIIMLSIVVVFLMMMLWTSNRLGKKQAALIDAEISRERYVQILNDSTDLIYQMDVLGYITYANKTMVDLYNNQKLLGNHMSELVSESHKEKVAKFFKNIIENKEFDRELEFSSRSNNNERIWIGQFFTPMYKDEKLIGYQATARNVTENKKLKFQLERAKIKAQGSLKAKEIFFANMSHEIRTPINAIIGMGNLLSKTPLSEKQKSYFKNIRLSANNLLIVINDILDLSKIDAGKLSIEKINFSFTKLFQNIKDTNEYRISEKSILYEEEIDPKFSQLIFEGDPFRINQILLNFLSNAIKFTDQGTIKLIAKVNEIKEGVVSIQLGIKDSGIGVKKDKQNLIFNSFDQEETGTSRKYGGTGLGLSISKKITELLKGNIGIESELGKGSYFYINLNMPIGKELIEDEKSKREIVNLQGMKILIAEDNIINMVYVSSVLEDLECEVFKVENGREAVSLLKDTDVDLILMDIQMPELDGYQTAREIRENLKKSTPIIALTANAFKEDVEKVKAAGMNGFVSKPFDPIDLITEIGAVMEGSEFVKKDNTSSIEVAEEITELDEPLFSLKKLESHSRGNKEFLLKMINIFKEEMPRSLLLLKEALKNEDWIKVSQIAHKIKPSIDLFEIGEITKVVRELESEGKKNSPDILKLIENSNLIIKTCEFVVRQL